MSDDEESIISRLERLQITRREIIAEEERLLQELRSEQNAQAPGAAGAARRTAVGDFQVGDHVHITNDMQHIRFRRRATPADRAAIVERAANTRVCFRTYNGHSTWRAPDDLRHLTPRERANIRETYLP